LAIRLRDGGTLIGTAALLVPHPPAGCPWVGLLIIHRDWQSQGLGREAALAIEEALAEEGWSEVRLSVLKTNADALPFWESRLPDHRRARRHDRPPLLGAGERAAVAARRSAG
jgi:ribosomal protein S18 acetylase RimI-like enzyme